MVVLERFKTEEVFEAIERYRVTWFPGVPTMFTYLIKRAERKTKRIYLP